MDAKVGFYDSYKKDIDDQLDALKKMPVKVSTIYIRVILPLIGLGMSCILGFLFVLNRNPGLYICGVSYDAFYGKLLGLLWIMAAGLCAITALREKKQMTQRLNIIALREDLMETRDRIRSVEKKKFVKEDYTIAKVIFRDDLMSRVTQNSPKRTAFGVYSHLAQILLLGGVTTMASLCINLKIAVNFSAVINSRGFFLFSFDWAFIIIGFVAAIAANVGVYVLFLLSHNLLDVGVEGVKKYLLLALAAVGISVLLGFVIMCVVAGVSALFKGFVSFLISFFEDLGETLKEIGRAIMRGIVICAIIVAVIMALANM